MNELLTIADITRESLRVLKNNLMFVRGIGNEYKGKFGVKGREIGDTLSIRKPPRYKVRSGKDIDLQGIKEQKVPLVLEHQKGVDLNFTSADKLLSLGDASEKIVQPAVAALANQVDYIGLQEYMKVANSVGVPGTTPADLKTFLDAKARLASEGCPQDKLKSIVINEYAEAGVIDGLKGLFQSSTQIAKQYNMGTMGMAAGFQWHMDQNIAKHRVGALGGAPKIKGADQTGAVLVTDGWTASGDRLKAGDVFTIAGVRSVNPQNRQSTGKLRQFVVLEDAASDATGEIAIKIFPAMQDKDDAFATIDVLPADNAAITVMGVANTEYAQNLAFHRDAFTYAMVDLPLPGGTHKAAMVRDPATGISVRCIEDYIIATDTFVVRLDILFGFATRYGELCTRIWGE